MVAHELWGLDYAGSNPVTPTIFENIYIIAKALSDFGTTLIVVVI